MARPTTAQQQALEVLQRLKRVRVSNVTLADDGGRIYWQTARWLLNSGYARVAGWDGSSEYIEITAAGKEAQ